MPTYYWLGNIAIRIYPKDHAPAHIHAVGPNAEAKFEIKTLKLVANYGFSKKAVRQIQEFLEARKELLLEKWHENQK